VRIERKPLYQSVGEKLKQGREGAGLTQTQMAEAIGLQRTSVTQIEKGVQGAPLHVLYEMCSVLGLEIRDLLPSCQEAAQLTLLPVKVNERTLTVPPKTAGLLRQMDERLRGIASRDGETNS
jgi:DNA-binding XRE family transcriptional regulator